MGLARGLSLGIILAYWVTILPSAVADEKAADSEKTKEEKAAEAEKAKDAGSLQIDFADPEEEKLKREQATEGDVFYAPPIELFFQNPAIQANLSSGVDAINSSVDNLMDSLFYSIMTNETNVYFNDFVWYNFNLRRRLFTTPAGSYIIVDRFQMGPVYDRVLWTVDNIPITLGIDGEVEATQIYMRTDGMRLALEREMSTARRLANNWFGLVPALAAVLPPSFNQNQLYDPITEIQTPFVFPLDVDKFYTMPVGSIRSYGLSGGIRLGPDFAGLLDQPTQDLLQRIGGLQASLPYAIFRRGEHRINVLRHSEHTAWVGVTDLKRTGHSIQPFLGQRYFFLSGALSLTVANHFYSWSGVPADVFPITIDLEQALVKLFDQVYEYDLRIPAAQEAYEAAVKGDFLPSWQRHLDAKEKGIETGVQFRFARTQDRHEVVSTNGPNVAVYKKERRRTLDSGEIEIKDQDGKFYVLESTLNVDDKKWNILTGEDEERAQELVEMKVRRVVAKDAKDPSEDYTYAFEPGPDPYRVTMTLSIQDKYVDTWTLDHYLEDLRFFTYMPMDDLPHFPERDTEKEADWRKQGFYASPADQINNIHVPPTYLGRFGAQAAVGFSTAQILKIVASSEDAMWVAFAKAYGVPPEKWGSAAARDTVGFKTQGFKWLFSYPLRLINVRFAEFDAFMESAHAIEYLVALKDMQTPVEKLEGFRGVFNTDHPLELARGLMTLADLKELPRKATLSAQPQGHVNEKVKASYGLLNNKTFKAGPAFPAADRYAKAKATLAKFYLDQPRESESKPHITKMQVTTRPIPDSIRSLSDKLDSKGNVDLKSKTRQVFVTFRVDDTPSRAPIKVFVRIDQGGKLKLGKLTLAEDVIELRPLDGGALTDKAHAYEFFLTGPLSPLSNDALDRAVADGEQFDVTMAVSVDTFVWSNERTFQFVYADGQLYPVK